MTRLSFLVTIVAAALCASTMTVEMTDNQVAFYLRGAEERGLLEEVGVLSYRRLFAF